MAGSGLSYLNLLRSTAAIAWDPVGLLLERPQEDRLERDWSPYQGALRSNQRVGCGQSWGGLSGGPWDNLWPYGFGLGVRRARHFRCNHSWTCVCRQSLMLKTQRMGNSRGLSFKIDLWPTNCKVLQGHFACVIKLTPFLVEGTEVVVCVDGNSYSCVPSCFYFSLAFSRHVVSPPFLLHKDVFCSSWTF